jgi:hypothetical protein
MLMITVTLLCVVYSLPPVPEKRDRTGDDGTNTDSSQDRDSGCQPGWHCSTFIVRGALPVAAFGLQCALSFPRSFSRPVIIPSTR